MSPTVPLPPEGAGVTSLARATTTPTDPLRLMPPSGLLLPEPTAATRVVPTCWPTVRESPADGARETRLPVRHPRVTVATGQDVVSPEDPDVGFRTVSAGAGVRTSLRPFRSFLILHSYGRVQRGQTRAGKNKGQPA